MRRRVLTTTKILSVAFAILPGCTKPEAKPEPIASTPSVSASVVLSELTEAPKLDATAPDLKVLALADELGTIEKNDALARIDHFRPLCDDKGYPLVGNVPTKAALTPSQLCAAVRKQKTP